MGWLRITSPDGHRSAQLQATNSLGRHPSNSIQVLDKIVSKEHCIIEQRGAIFVLRDLGSLNGTFVNGKRVDRPSFHVKPGMTVGIKERTRNKSVVQEAVEQATAMVRPSWLEFDPAKVEGTLHALPDRLDVPFEINEAAIIEFYSQKL